MSNRNDVKLGDNVSVICQNEECTVYEMTDTTGDGIMTYYHVFPGIEVVYNHFHMQSCFSEFESNKELLCIDHCREGRLEWETKDGSYVYIGAGDLHITTHEYGTKNFSFPLSNYHGITIGISIEEAAKAMPSIIGGLPIDIYSLRDKFENNNKSFVMRAGASIEHIFSELYTAPEEFRNAYHKIKVLELLLFLSASEIKAESAERQYFQKTQIGKVKDIMQFITQNIGTNYTLEEISERFNIPLTNMKLCFKSIYGTTIYAYTREYRMKLAAERLLNSNDTVVTIASSLGYDNASKFSSAFKKVMGKTPAEFRKFVV